MIVDKMVADKMAIDKMVGDKMPVNKTKKHHSISIPKSIFLDKTTK